MPFKSKKQRAKFAEMVKQGKIPQTTFDEWNRETPADLPERINNGPVKSIDELRAKINQVKKK